MDQNNNKVSLLITRIVIYCNVVTFKLLGLAPWSVNISNIFDSNDRDIKNKSPCEFSNCGLLYNVLLIILLVGYSAVLYSSPEWTKNYPYLSAMMLFQIILMISGSLVCVSIWFYSILRQNDFINNANELNSVNKNLRRSKYCELKKNNIINISYFGNFILCASIMIMGIIAYPFELIVLWYIPIILLSWVLIQHTIVLSIIYQHIECINNIILKMGRLDTEMEIQTLITPRDPLHELIIADIMDINNNHRKLYEISKKFSSYFAIFTLVAVIYFAAITIVESRYFILLLAHKINSSLSREFLLADICLWLLLVIFHFVALTTCVTKTMREVLMFIL